MIIPGNFDITIYAGADLDEVLKVGSYVDLNNYVSAVMMVRVVISDQTPFINLNTSNGGLTINGTDNTIAIFLSAAATAAITVPAGVYQLFITNNTGGVARLMQGNIYVDASVVY